MHIPVRMPTVEQLRFSQIIQAVTFESNFTLLQTSVWADKVPLYRDVLSVLVAALFYSGAKLWEGEVEGILRGSQLMMSKHWRFPEHITCDTSDLLHLLKYKQLYSRSGEDILNRERVFHNPIHLCLILSLPFIALLWIHAARTHVDVYIRSNEHLLVWFTNVILPPPITVSCLCCRPGSSPQLSHDDTHTRIEHYANR